MTRIYTCAAAALLLILALGATSSAGALTSPRSMAMGEAYTGLARGVDAARFNPANLGLRSYRQSGLELIGIGLNVTNNSFTLDDYNTYTGAFLTDSDKEDILNKIPEDGLTVSANAEASALSLGIGSLVLSGGATAVSDVNLSKDLVDIILNGNTFADTIDVSSSYSDAVGYGYLGLSYGMPLMSSGSRQLSVGATFKYVRGLGFERVVELEGLASTEEDGFYGSGKAVVRTATGGSGYAFDWGAALQLNDNYTVGLAFHNFLSSITWSDNTEEHGYEFDFDTMTVDNMDEDYVTSDDYTREIESFSSNLPSTMTLGIAKHTGTLKWAVDWRQGFREQAAGASTKPRLAMGVEWGGLGVLPLRTGFSTGGDGNTGFSFGSGLSAGPFYLDMAVVTGTSMTVYSSKGANLAIATGFEF